MELVHVTDKRKRMNYERESKKDIWTTHASIVKRRLLIVP